MTNRPKTPASAIAEARSKGVARLDAELMLARILARPRTWLIAHDDAVLLDTQAADWEKWLGRRAAGEPLAYLLGEKEFSGLMLDVTADVLVPRPETELLVEWADELLRGRLEAAAVLDLGTGTGAIALAIKSRHASAIVTATDNSAEALVVARGNAARHALVVEFIEAAWWCGLEGRRFDLVVSNPPYIAGGDPALVDLRHEPVTALTPGRDGTAALASIASGSAAHLRPGGWLLLEHGFAQGPAVRDLLHRNALAAIETRRDLAGHERASGGRQAGRPS
ncbi:MAG: peptide chain release factor N(5)-glutamine methyltransferase [Pseudomonadota bacterium]|nr:peptide chain release factor N(5)-glutamine methyltransferase [Pseudomonadota bacterium]